MANIYSNFCIVNSKHEKDNMTNVCYYIFINIVKLYNFIRHKQDKIGKNIL